MKKRSTLILFLAAFVPSMFYAQQTINQSTKTTTTCDANYYDNGGPDNNYAPIGFLAPATTTTQVFKPALAGNFIKIVFSSFQSATNDNITIYDGPSTASPIIYGPQSGIQTIPTIISSHPSGNITVTFFTAQGSGGSVGWVAKVSCICKPTASSITDIVCDTYTSPSGQIWDTSGVYVDTISNVGGCDSVMTIDLTIKKSSSATWIEEACQTFTSPSGNVYDLIGSYIVNDVIDNVAGCDSIIKIYLTVNDSTTTEVSTNGSTITADGTGTYQWIDCGDNNAPISGATSKSYTASANGSYALILTNSCGSDTSDCVVLSSVGINELNTSNSGVVLSPNPTTGKVQFTFNGVGTSVITVVDATGKVIVSANNVTSGDTISLEGTQKGMYIVKVVNALGTSTHRIIKN
jgi:hypothetical protein